MCVTKAENTDFQRVLKVLGILQEYQGLLTAHSAWRDDGDRGIQQLTELFPWVATLRSLRKRIIDLAPKRREEDGIMVMECLAHDCLPNLRIIEILRGLTDLLNEFGIDPAVYVAVCQGRGLNFMGYDVPSHRIILKPVVGCRDKCTDADTFAEPAATILSWTSR